MAKAKKLTKPTKQKKEFYDYLEVTHYLEHLHGKSFRDYAGRFGSKPYDDSIPYLDFWHWHMDAMGGDVSNGCFIYMPEVDYLAEDTPDWVKEILGYFQEFLGDSYNEEMWLSW